MFGATKLRLTFGLLSVIIVISCGTNEASAATVECLFSKFRWGHMLESVYYCDARNKEIFDGKRVIIDSIDGEHDEGRDNSQVQGFLVMNAPNVAKFPANLAGVFPNLIAIWVDGSKLTEITESDLRPFAKLEYLYLQDNLIKTIAADTFALNPNLRVVMLARNPIERIDAGAFGHLSNLFHLDLSGTACTSVGLSDSRKQVEETVKLLDDGACH